MNKDSRFDRFPHVGLVSEVLKDEAPYMAGVIGKQQAEFGDSWLAEFEADLATFFAGRTAALKDATRGYIKFALDGMLLQKRFDKARRYEPKSYDEAAAEVYQNEQYMHTLYLPGIYLSHFLWRHHYIQHVFFMERFVPLARQHGGRTFYDVGVGTGFYSREMMRHIPGLHGQGFDLSASSLSYTESMVAAFGLKDRYKTNLRDIVANPVPEPASFLTNVEVLEHLEDPVSFLKSLAAMLAPGGLGLITAAVTAPNADHIYLYNSLAEVVDHVEQAGFRVLDSREDRAYEPKPGASVPRNAVVIVTK